jgi:DNA-nicking Smr family endonuclease
MAAKKKSPKTKNAPFNNPFADNIKKLRKRLSARKPQPPERTQPKPAETDAVLTDEDAFTHAMSGAVPVKASGREVTHNPKASESVRVCAQDFDPDELLSDANFDIRFSDQFIRARCRSVSRETFDKLEKGVFAVRSHVDLHGMALDDAKQTVDEFLTDCQRREERCVLVITGKGRNSPGQVGVLRQGIPEWLARGPSARRVLAFVSARQCDGGEGALYVLLRKRAGRKTRIDVESGGGA